ncbi:MAG: DUF3014 domain-containing protein [Candidatus Aminicenantes bacterium]|nr:DUF3014 domain-containing protein [Candidatus Aminicenantes bacterium]
MDEKQKVIRAGVGAIILIVLGVAAYYLFFSGRGGGPAVSGGPSAAEKLAAEAPGVKDAAVSPISAELDKSDEAVRGLAADLSSNAVFLEWLKSKDLIRRFVAAVDNIANGQSPRPQVDFFGIRAPFKVLEGGGKTTIDPASYDRYNVVADVFESLSPAGCARLFESARPLIDQAYRDLGYPRADFRQTLLRAVHAVLRAPVVEGPLEVEKGVVAFAFKDPRYEALDEVEKHLLRMGPENLQLIQVKLRAIAMAMGFSEAQLPPARASGPSFR